MYWRIKTKSIPGYQIIFLCLVLIFAGSGLCQDKGEEEVKDKPKKVSIFRLTEHDLLLPITSIEWGHPDRWSFTSRYIHAFEDSDDDLTWRNNISAFLCPGLSGGRFGISYLGLYDPPETSDFGIFFELRGVLLRTWADPLDAVADETYAAIEFKACLSFLLNASVGYYIPIDSDGQEIESFWGFHFGVGI